ncbi:MAG: hypothetical protein A2Y38_00495 [Spirochaetes bacterium GWB1_59_5]|nr:MAG: hypothetical protein A2Y38_00495 [Spirochaetes bacterium GWB1_59_5]
MPDERLDGKLELYRNFWDMKPVSRPMVGFDVGGWFPFQRYADLRNIQEKGFIEPEMLDARRCLPDYDAFMARCLEVDDDFIKGVCPVSAIPWMEGMLGCALQRSGQSVWAVERMASWEELSGLALSAESADNPWFRKYIEFVQAAIADLQALLRRINALIQSFLTFAVTLPSFSGLMLRSKGTDNLLAEFLAAENKPADGPSYLGAGIVVIGVSPIPLWLLDTIFLIKEKVQGGDSTDFAQPPPPVGTEAVQPAPVVTPDPDPL